MQNNKNMHTANIEFKPMDLAQLNNLASEKLGFRIQKWTYSQADLQPAYGVIFDEYIQGFDFWGHFDIDVVWGDIRSFITEEILKNYQIISFTCKIYYSYCRTRMARWYG